VPAKIKVKNHCFKFFWYASYALISRMEWCLAPKRWIRVWFAIKPSTSG